MQQIMISYLASNERSADRVAKRKQMLLQVQVTEIYLENRDVG